ANLEKLGPGPTIARSLGENVEFLRVDAALVFVSTARSSFCPASPTIACEWISDSCLALFDSNYQFRMLDTLSNLVVGRCDATRVQLVTRTIPSHPDLNSYENSIRAFRGIADETNFSLYML